MKKRFIEERFPLEKMSKLSQKEKGATRKTLSALHLWWARRPLTLSRAVIAACILPAPNGESERDKIEKLIGRACTLEAGAGRKEPSNNRKRFEMDIDFNLHADQHQFGRLVSHLKPKKISIINTEFSRETEIISNVEKLISDIEVIRIEGKRQLPEYFIGD